MTATPVLNPATTAVPVVGTQHDDLHAHGAFAASGAADHAACQVVVRSVRTVLGAARCADAALFHNRTVVDPGRDVGGSNAPSVLVAHPGSGVTSRADVPTDAPGRCAEG